MTEPSFAETVEPEEAFALLSDATRIGILRELWAAEGHRASFSALREAVGVEDSGQFNYHLNQLRDRFVRKTDDGYELTAAGIRVVGAILGGAYTVEGSADPIPLDVPCPTCGGRWTFRYEEEFATFACEECSVYIEFPVPPGVYGGSDPEKMPERTERYLRTLLEQLRNGICPYCESPTRPMVVREEPPEGSEELSTVPLVEWDCSQCAGDVVTDLATPLLAHPEVVGFFYERGVDVRERPIWRLTAFDPDRTSFDSTDPIEVSVSFEEDGDVLTVTVDESLTVLDVEQP